MKRFLNMKWITEQSFCNWKNHHPVHFQSLFKALFLVQSNSLMIFFFNHHQLKAKRRNQNDTAGHTSIVSLQKKQKTPQDRTKAPSQKNCCRTYSHPSKHLSELLVFLTKRLNFFHQLSLVFKNRVHYS